MARHSDYPLVIVESREGDPRARKSERRVPPMRRRKALVSAAAAARALKAMPRAAEVIARIPSLAKPARWAPTASFTVCKKTGTALYLDIWDADHFDGFTDMPRCLTDCRAWFSADGFTYWDSPQTKTGRINCYFRAPAAGPYVCTAELESYGGPATVECVIDSSSFGLLPVNGVVVQPHMSTLNAGYHSFRIRQRTGSFFFVGLTVWKV